MTTNLDQFVRSTISQAEWLVHRYDAPRDAFQMIQVDRATRAGIPFLVDEHLGTPSLRAFRRADLPACSTAPMHFIFHSAYCCSTLLARSLDVPGVATTLKEPQVLNDMVGWRHRGATPAQIRPVLDQSLALLARPFEDAESVIVKPSNVVNALIGGMLSLRTDAHALLMYAPLPVFVASIARKGMWGRLWVRDLLKKQLADGIVDLGFSPGDYLLHTDLQAAAVGWLAQQALFTRLATAMPHRVRLLSSEVLVSQPARSIDAVAKLFGLRLEEKSVAALVADNFTRDAKTGAAFEVGRRSQDQADGLALHRDEIEKVVVWAHAVAEAAGVAIAPPAALHLSL
ncbi:hypothetical protein KZ810_00800 [Sphingomonas sp. RHCKR47]|uniref:hypothetical protein n=1 Tax=Sphingomonas citricola TaxID=2862498 RepID=UPI001CA4E89F|nr:hypothetical protein [Sphingomonas citricola]MBW6522025.1 hypothetical protein [Sphingomonas citricola]